MSHNIIERNGQKFVTVGTSNAFDCPAGFAVITSNLREVKGSNISPNLKHRNVVIPEFSLPESVDKKFHSVLLDKFYNLAKSYLDDVMEESNRMKQEIALSDFSIENLLGYFGRVAVSSRLTGDTVGAWFDTSATRAALLGKIAAKGMDTATGAATLKKYRDLFVKTASPNHGINPNTCTVLLAMIDPSEAGEGIGETLAGKWAATVEKSTQSEVEAL